MQLKIIVIRDIRANVHGIPMFVPNIAVALRQLGDQINEPANKDPVAMHPEDFEIWELGTYDDERGWFETEHDASHTQRRQICACKDLVRQKQ